jgi:hypothetical protein
MPGTTVAAAEQETHLSRARPPSCEELVMTRTLARLALAAIVGGALWSLRRQTGRQDTQTKAKQPAVQTWEGEGGALPTTGSQMGPDPVSPVLPEAHETY